MESNPDFACNTLEVYEKLLKDSRFREYHFTWAVGNMKRCAGRENERTSVVPVKPAGCWNRLKTYIHFNRAEVAIAACKPFYKSRGNRKQLNIYLDHASQMKNMKIDQERIDIDCDYTISQGHFFDRYIVDQYEVTGNQIVNCGIPRNDQFYRETKDIRAIYEDAKKFSKIIAWVPTFRISSTNRVDCSFDLPLGLPIIYDAETAKKINDYLITKNILLIFKPHPSQNLSVLKELDMSNIRFLYNEQMMDAGFQTNEFLHCCDAMITDYSGIYYDYLCLDRPIGITLDDYEAYREEHGFVFDNPLDILKGYRIYDVEGLCKFAEEVSENTDSMREERNKINHLVNDFDDGKSADRFVDFLADKLGLGHE